MSDISRNVQDKVKCLEIHEKIYEQNFHEHGIVMKEIVQYPQKQEVLNQHGLVTLMDLPA